MYYHHPPPPGPPPPPRPSSWNGQHWGPPPQSYSPQYAPPAYPPPNHHYSQSQPQYQYPPPTSSYSPTPYSPRDPRYSSPAHSPYGTPPLPPRPPSESSSFRSYPASPSPWGPGANNNPPRPPSGTQPFGHGAPSSYRFQYSACTGRRRALLIGINYFGQPNQLQGCINDVTNVSTFLAERHGYRREDMVILTDDQKNPKSVPTKANILRAMQWLVSGAVANDSLFIHFSGHGGRTPDLDGDEDDGELGSLLFCWVSYGVDGAGFDDVIYPVDYRVAGHIVDDEMHDIMIRPLQPGVRLTAIFDSCHSGTALDLPYVYSTQGILKEPNLAKEAASDLFSAITSYGRGDLSGVAQTAIGFFKKAAIGDSARRRTVRTKTSPADVVMFSGSKDTQTSADTFQDGEARGALSWAFIKVLQRYPQLSYVQLLNLIRAELEGKYTQKPQLSCSHPLGGFLLLLFGTMRLERSTNGSGPIDTNLLFVM
ncbi:caspase family protein [Aspergillus mulundensis]|uniref:Metacaspase-1B n=1 Tax=Aspergillus mulundensis TaxID=1810919 RepID=A0A3D8QZV9_9EURO|nr:Metacaspase [Aspergillus mulundensis]RDW67336.1 Metacaspase [Aspergillus mulundensis]